MFANHQIAEINRRSLAHQESYVLAILTDGKDASGLVNTLIDAVTEAGGMDVLARTALSCGPTVAGAALIKLIYDAFAEEAEKEATREVMEEILYNASCPENFRPKNAGQVRLLETV